MNINIKWQLNMKFSPANYRLGNLQKEKNTLCGVNWTLCCLQREVHLQGWVFFFSFPFFFISWISWEKGKGGLVLVRKGSLRKAQRRGETESNCRKAYFFIKILMLLLKGASNISRATFLKCQQKFFSVMQWFNDQ